MSISGNGLPSALVRVSVRADRIDGRKLRVGRDDAELLLLGERLLAQCLIAHVKAAFELLDPLLGRVMGCVAGAGGVVEEERLLGGHRLGVLDELERLVCDVLGEVIALLGSARLIDRMVVVNQIRIPLVRLGAEEPVPALKAAATWPVAARGR